MPKAKGGGGGGAKWSAKSLLAASTNLVTLLGRTVDVPNGLWQGFDDGGFTTGVIKKAGREKGADVVHVQFAVQDGWRTPPTWISFDTIVGKTPVAGTRHYCRLGDPPAPASKAKPSAPPLPAANRKRKAKA